MPDTSPPPVLTALREHARAVAGRAYAPFSGRPEGAALLLADGTWVPGARVESSSFPLSIPALQAAFVIAAMHERLADVVAAAWTRELRPSEQAWLSEALGATPVATSATGAAFAATLPEPGAALPLWLDAPLPSSDAEGIALARRVARSAHVPESDFPVGCVLVVGTPEGERLVGGANVEHGDWTRGLCAERTALAVRAAAGGGAVRRAYLTCLRVPGCTPCGACRQLLAEHLPEVPLVIDRGAEAPLLETPGALLPHHFRGETLAHRPANG